MMVVLHPRQSIAELAAKINIGRLVADPRKNPNNPLYQKINGVTEAA
jgi:hypothetical protein